MGLEFVGQDLAGGLNAALSYSHRVGLCKGVCSQDVWSIDDMGLGFPREAPYALSHR